MVDNLTQDTQVDDQVKEEPDFFEEHSNSDNKTDQSPIIPPKKVGLRNAALLFNGLINVIFSDSDHSERGAVHNVSYSGA